MSVKTENPVEILMAVAEANGVAASSVQDGHVLVFKRAYLQRLLASLGSQEHVVMFVKRPPQS